MDCLTIKLLSHPSNDIIEELTGKKVIDIPGPDYEDTIEEYKTENLSTCCGWPVYVNGICSKCKDHDR